MSVRDSSSQAAGSTLGLGQFLSAASLASPELIIQSAWLGHAPFALWLVDAMQPRRFVELGVHTGFSYFVFCQAAERGRVGTCVGVDTWVGDDQTGSYGEDVYDTVAAYNERYGERSRLLRMTFDEALDQIEPGSVDLLHIDGCHRYEDVRHDFEAWEDRMSPGGVVLLHDTHEQKGNFGVWRLWERLTASYPTFEFPHEHGLGIVAVGASVAPPVAMLCSIEPGSAVAAEIWDAYRELGESVRNKGVIASLASRERELNAELSVLRSQAREAAREASEAAREASEAAREASEAAREASEAAMEAYVTRWERDRLAARIAENTPSDEGATLIRAARAIASFLRDHPRTAQALRRAAGFVDGRRSKASIAHDYRAWIKHFDSVSANSFEANEVLRGINIRRRLSIVMPVCDPVPEFLAAAIGSVERQIYPDWELVVVDDGSVDSPVRDALESLHHRDERIRVIHRERRGGISAALNTGLDNASGEFVAFLDHDDVLATDALLIVALLLDERPDVSLVYSDEDALDEAGSRTAPYFKPDWNPSLLLGQNFACHFLVCRKNLVQSIGGFRSDFDGAQDWDLALRIAEAVEDEHIAHLPHVLYHWRRHAGSTAAGVAAKPYVVDAGRRAVEEALQRRNVPASPVSLSNGWNRLVYELPAEAPDVDVVVPTALAHPFVGLCLKRVLDQTHYPALAIKLVVSETSLSERGSRLPKSIRDDPRVTVVPYEGDSFNYSRAVNLGAASGKAELLCLLNDDVIATESGWLTALAARAIQPGVGATGALLRFPDETIQHGGVILGLGDAALAYHEGVPVGQPGYCGRALLDQDLSCVTAACMVVRRQVFDQLAGFDESFEVSFNDVDFCLRLRAAGWRIVWTPEARLYHTESTSVRQIPGRVSQYQDESRRMWERWASVLSSDPFYSPNLSLAAPNALAWPPRVIRPTLAPG